MFQYTFGDVGSGKSLTLASQIKRCLWESLYIQKRFHLPLRKIFVNIPLSKRILDKYGDRLFYWENPYQMIYEDYPKNTIIRRNFDCFIDELNGYLASDKWKDTPEAIRRFFARHRKRGIRIFGNTQDYMMLDINARRMTDKSVLYTKKLFGSRDPSPTLPPVRHIWGLIMIRKLDKRSLEIDSKQPKIIGLPHFTWIRKSLTEFYDMSQEITGFEEPELVHKVRSCPTCGFEKISHI